MSPRLLAIPDLSLAPLDAWLSALDALAASLPAGALAVQLRMPGASAGPMLRVGRALLGVLGARAPIVVNDRLDVAVALGARAVHLGRLSVSARDARAVLGPEAWVSRACHDDEELLRAEREGADAALLSPVFSSPGKGPPLGIAALRRACESHPRLAVYALGGVGPAEAPACLQAGAAGVAAIRSILDAGAWT